MVVQGTAPESDRRRLSILAPAKVVVVEASAIERPGIRLAQRNHRAHFDRFAGFEATCREDASSTPFAGANRYVSHVGSPDTVLRKLTDAARPMDRSAA